MQRDPSSAAPVLGRCSKSSNVSRLLRAASSAVGAADITGSGSAGELLPWEIAWARAAGPCILK